LNDRTKELEDKVKSASSKLAEKEKEFGRKIAAECQKVTKEKEKDASKIQEQLR